MSSHAKPRVCFVAPAAWPVLSGDTDIPVVGGAEVQQCILARRLAANGYQVSMICLDYGQADGIQVDGVTVYRAHAPDAGVPVLRFIHPRLTSIWSAMRRANADIYYQRSASMLTGVVAAFCRRHAKRCVYAGAMDLDFIPGRQPIRYARDRFLFEYGLKHAHQIVVQNRQQQTDCRQHYRRDGIFVPSAYVQLVAGGADPRGVVLWVATIRPNKRPELFIALARALPQFRFRMVGGPGGHAATDQDYFEHIRGMAQAVPNLEFTGFAPYLAAEAHFNQARLFVNTSETEGFPNTFLQAWARRIPVLVFFDMKLSVEGEPVCAVAGDERSAVESIRLLMTDDVLWRSSGERGHAYFRRHHSVDHALELYEQIFMQLMASEISEGSPVLQE